MASGSMFSSRVRSPNQHSWRGSRSRELGPSERAASSCPELNQLPAAPPPMLALPAQWPRFNRPGGSPPPHRSRHPAAPSRAPSVPGLGWGLGFRTEGRSLRACVGGAPWGCFPNRPDHVLLPFSVASALCLQTAQASPVSTCPPPPGLRSRFCSFRFCVLAASPPGFITFCLKKASRSPGTGLGGGVPGVGLVPDLRSRHCTCDWTKRRGKRSHRPPGSP